MYTILKKYPLLLLILTMPFVATKGEGIPSDSIRISLLTCEPGEEAYSLYGHTAIRYEDFRQHTDVVYNYGIFSFSTPNFMLRFALGETDYLLGKYDYQRFEAEYFFEGRSVWQQTLNLTTEEKHHLINLLETNYQPANRMYRYNFFYDNCSTRPRDKIAESIDGKVVYGKPQKPDHQGPKTFRDIVHQYTKGHPWSQFGIDLCIGRDADRPITREQMMFAPLYLMDFYSTARIETATESRPLVTETSKIVDVSLENDTPWCPSPLQTSLTLFIIVALATIYGLRKEKSMWGIDVFLFAAAGIAGSILAFLALLSQHPAVSCNYLLFVFHPFHLLLLPFFIKAERKRRKSWYHVINFTVLTLFIVLFLLIPQRIDFAVVPLALCLLIRSASNLILTYKKQ